MRKLLLLVFLLIFPLALLTSEIAPVEYRSMQLNAPPEKLQLSVKRVSKRWRPFTGGTAITVKAIVIGGVVSSETNLAEGDSISISYIHQRQKKGGGQVLGQYPFLRGKVLPRLSWYLTKIMIFMCRPHVGGHPSTH